MKRRPAFLALLIWLIVFSLASIPVAAKDTWISVRTKNFLLVGNASEKEVRQVGVRLEQFREVFTHLLPNIRFNTPVPTTVIVFKSDSSFTPFKPGPNVAGYFQPGPDVNYIALTTEVRGEQDPFNVIFHEYTHLLVDNTIDNAPTWFNEGLAEYYSTFSITNDQKFVLGTPIANHVLLLRENKMLPLRTLFQVDHHSPYYNERNKQSIFYAQSWAFIHYLIIGKQGRVEQLAKFIELLNSKVPMEKAFTDAFQTTFEAFEKDLRNYIRQDRYNVLGGHFEHKLGTDTTAEAQPVSEAEVQAYLGDLLLHSHSSDCMAYLERAVKLDPNLAMAHASLGMAQFRKGQADEARASLERAVKANSQNYLIHYYYAFALSRTHEDESPVSGYPPEIASKIYEELQKSIALRPDFPESYNLLAFVSLVTGNKIDDAMAQLQKVIAATPGRSDLSLMLAQLYLRKNDYGTARQILEQVAKSNADEDVLRHAESLLSQIKSYQEQLAKYETEKKEQGTRVANTSSDPVVIGQTSVKKQSKPADPSAYLREVLRQPAEGETQLQGILVKIECAPKSIVFTIKVGEQLLRLKTESFDNMEITTYNPEVKGDIGCGSEKAGEHVVICFAPSTDKRIKVDGLLKSIEFVPKDFQLKPAD